MFTQLQLPVRRYDSLDGSDLIGGGLMDLPFEDFQDNVRPSAGLRGLTKECAVAPVCVCDGGCSQWRLEYVPAWLDYPVLTCQTRKD